MVKKCKNCKKEIPKIGNRYNHKYGYGLDCGCYQNWLFNTPEGKEKLKKATLQAKKKVEQEKKREWNKKKKELTNYKSKLQDKINEIVRLIDYGLPCLARGIIANQIHAGHVYSRGSEPSMKFNLHNIHRQSAQSNHYQNEDGLLREGLVNEYGKEYLDFLNYMRSYPPLKFTNEEYHEFYKVACKIANTMRKEGKRYTTPKQRIEKRNEVNKQIGIYKQFNEFKN